MSDARQRKVRQRGEFHMDQVTGANGSRPVRKAGSNWQSQQVNPVGCDVLSWLARSDRIAGLGAILEQLEVNQVHLA
jgi:hypothetical protein